MSTLSDELRTLSREAYGYHPMVTMGTAPERGSNWLPAPFGSLGVAMRLHAPHPEVLDGRWSPPSVRQS
jgi:hypothetical protein